MNVVIAGSTGLDDIESSYGRAENVLGGSAIYASIAASFFSQPGIISCYGEDFPKKFIEVLKKRKIDLQGFQKVKGKNFHWKGKYGKDLNEAITLKTDLNSMLEFKPIVPDSYKEAEFIMLGNLDPEIQLKLLEQFEKPKFIISDTMNYWIESKKEKVLEVIDSVDIALMNGSEAKMLFNTSNLIHASKELLKRNSEFAVIKKGEHGAMLFTESKTFIAPAYPLEHIKDPTGAGDCFGGAIIGYLSSIPEINFKEIRKAIAFGSAIASLNVEEFSTKKLEALTMKEINGRLKEFKELSEF